jgi:hypothetical protein
LRRVKRSEAAARRSDDVDEQNSSKKKKEPKIKKPPKKKYKTDNDTSLNLNDTSMVSGSPPQHRHHAVTPKEQPMKTVRCGRCGTIGHSRTNRECPMYVPKDLNVSHNTNNESINDDTSQISGLTKVQGSKLIIDKRLIAAQQ